MATPQSLQLYSVVQRSQINECIEKNMLEIPKDWWYIGLRKTPEEAVVRAGQVGEQVDKDTHAILRVTFSLLGVAHFTQTYMDKSYLFEPVLHKICKPYDTRDKGAWHFNRNLPLSMSDDDGNPLIWTEFMEIL